MTKDELRALKKELEKFALFMNDGQNDFHISKTTAAKIGYEGKRFKVTSKEVVELYLQYINDK